MRDIMRNLPGSLGHGEFYIVIIYVPERTYIFLSLKGLKSPIVKGNEYTRTWLTQDIQKIYLKLKKIQI